MATTKGEDAATTSAKDAPAAKGAAAKDSAPTPTPAKGGFARLYGMLWTHAAGKRGALVAALVALGVAQAVRMTAPWLFGEAVNAMQTQGAQDIGRAGAFIGAIVCVWIVAWIFHGPARVVERRVALHARQSLAESLYAKVASLPLQWHERHHSGDTIHRIQKTTHGVFAFGQHQFIYLQNVVSVVAPVVAMVLVSATTGAIALVGYVFLFLLMLRYDRTMFELAKKEEETERRYSSALVDCVGNASTVAALRLEDATRAVLRARLADVAVPYARQIVVNEEKWATVDLLNLVLRHGLVAWYAWMSWRESGMVLVGTAVMINTYAMQLGSVVTSMGAWWGDLVRFQANVQNADPILSTPSRAPRAGGVPVGWREARVEGLTFTHHGKDAPTLRDVSLTLRRGGRVALVGASGSGKSTLLRALAGLYTPERATIVVDGAPLPGVVDFGAVAMLVPQDPEIFESTVGENVTMGVPRDPEAVRRACDLACFTAVVDELPQGLATPISERGADLSGGQRQRLALARGLLAAEGASLVLLDEPTSSIDPTTEARIYDGLLETLQDACVVSSIHRLHLLPRFDVVVLVEGGRAVDAGTIEELRARQPTFRAMWDGSVGVVAAAAAAAPAAAA